MPRKMPRSAAAEAAAGEVPLCPACCLPEHAGLCAPCSVDVLPQVKHPSWHRDAHRGKNAHADREAAVTADVEKQQRHADRRDAGRKGPRNWERKLGAQLRGTFTRNRRRRAA